MLVSRGSHLMGSVLHRTVDTEGLRASNADRLTGLCGSVTIFFCAGYVLEDVLHDRDIYWRVR